MLAFAFDTNRQADKREIIAAVGEVKVAVNKVLEAITESTASSSKEPAAEEVAEPAAQEAAAEEEVATPTAEEIAKPTAEADFQGGEKESELLKEVEEHRTHVFLQNEKQLETESAELAETLSSKRKVGAAVSRLP